jgi:hypothetical protein
MTNPRPNEAGSEEMVWVVDGYMNTIRNRKKTLLDRDVRRAAHPRKQDVFTTQHEAVKFLIARAEKELVAAVNAVNWHEDRVWRLKRKFTAQLAAPEVTP